MLAERPWPSSRSSSSASSAGRPLTVTIQIAVSTAPRAASPARRAGSPAVLGLGRDREARRGPGRRHRDLRAEQRLVQRDRQIHRRSSPPARTRGCGLTRTEEQIADGPPPPPAPAPRAGSADRRERRPGSSRCGRRPLTLTIRSAPLRDLVQRHLGAASPGRRRAPRAAPRRRRRGRPGRRARSRPRAPRAPNGSAGDLRRRSVRKKSLKPPGPRRRRGRYSQRVPPGAPRKPPQSVAAAGAEPLAGTPASSAPSSS